MHVERYLAWKMLTVIIGSLFVFPASLRVPTSRAQDSNRITKQSLIRACKRGKAERKTAASYLDVINEFGIDFSISPQDESEIRMACAYLGKDGLDLLLKAVRSNTRPSVKTRTPPPPITDPSLSYANDTHIEALGDEITSHNVSDLLKKAGYDGLMFMSVLIVTNTGTVDVHIGSTTGYPKKKNRFPTLAPGDRFTFPGGENAANVYVWALQDAKVSIAYKPRPVESLSTEEWIQTDDAKRFVAEMQADIDKLIDEARNIDLRTFKLAVSTYNDWVDKSSLILGQIDSKMRRFGKTTDYRFKWEQSARNFTNIFTEESRAKESFRLELNLSITRLEGLKPRIRLDSVLSPPK